VKAHLFPAGFGALSGLTVVFDRRVPRHGYSVYKVVAAPGRRGAADLGVGDSIKVGDALATRAWGSRWQASEPYRCHCCDSAVSAQQGEAK
jgi:hypothetical protein